MSMAHEDHRPGDTHDSDLSKTKAKYAEFVRIHAIEGKVINRDDEKKILEEGLTHFGLEFQDAQGTLLSVASERDIALISRVESHIDTNLGQKVKRGKISKQDFDDIVAVYGKLTNDSIPETEIRKRVKEMLLNRGWTGKRRRWLFNSKRWFKRI